jgi:hypothetical protein
VDDRTHMAAMALQALLTNGEQPERDEDPFMTLTYAAARYADALIAELHKVPAPSGGPVASPPGSDSPPTVQDVNKSVGGGSAPTPLDRCEKCTAVLVASNLCIMCGHVHGVPSRDILAAYPNADEVSRKAWAALAFPELEAQGPFVSGAASLHAGEDAAAQGAPPGDLALPPSATAGENPARPPSRKAKPGTPCGGPSCRDSITTWIHDPRTCPLYKPAKGLHVGPPMGTAIRGKS